MSNINDDEVKEELVDDVGAFVDIEEEEEEESSFDESSDSIEEETDEDKENSSDNAQPQPGSSRKVTYKTNNKNGPKRQTKQIKMFLTPIEKELYNALVKEKLRILKVAITDPDQFQMANIMAAFNIMKKRKFVDFIEKNPKGAAKVTKLLELQGFVEPKRNRRRRN